MVWRWVMSAHDLPISPPGRHQPTKSIELEDGEKQRLFDLLTGRRRFSRELGETGPRRGDFIAGGTGGAGHRMPGVDVASRDRFDRPAGRPPCTAGARGERGERALSCVKRWYGLRFLTWGRLRPAGRAARGGVRTRVEEGPGVVSMRGTRQRASRLVPWSSCSVRVWDLSRGRRRGVRRVTVWADLKSKPDLKSRKTIIFFQNKNSVSKPIKLNGKSIKPIGKSKKLIDNLSNSFKNQIMTFEIDWFLRFS